MCTCVAEQQLLAGLFLTLLILRASVCASRAARNWPVPGRQTSPMTTTATSSYVSAAPTRTEPGSLMITIETERTYAATPVLLGLEISARYAHPEGGKSKR